MVNGEENNLKTKMIKCLQRQHTDKKHLHDATFDILFLILQKKPTTYSFVLVNKTGAKVAVTQQKTIDACDCLTDSSTT